MLLDFRLCLDSFDLGPQTKLATGCQSNPCQNGGTCIDEAAGKWKCICQPGFEGVFCSERSKGMNIFISNLSKKSTISSYGLIENMWIIEQNWIEFGEVIDKRVFHFISSHT